MNENINQLKTYFQKNCISITNKLVEDDDDDEDLGGIQVHSILNILNTKWRKPALNEFSNEELFFIFHQVVISMIIYSKFYSIIIFMYLCSMIAASFGVSFAVVAYSLNCMRHLNFNEEKIKKLMEEEREYEESFQFKYVMFLNDYTEKMQEVYHDEEKLNEKFKNEDKEFLGSLKEKKEHYEIELPFERNKKLILYYDVDDETFYYYTQSSDVLYIVLNRCCQEYVYDKKCINLFKDEKEIEYIKSLNLDDDKIIENERIINSYERIEEDEEEKEAEDKKEEEKKEEPKSLFYKNEKKEKEKKENIEKNMKKLNKFVRKGNLNDYDNKFKEKKLSKKLNYEEYLNLFKI